MSIVIEYAFERRCVVSSATSPVSSDSAAPASYTDNVGTVQSATSTAGTTDDSTPGVNVGTLPAGTTPFLYVDGVKVAASYDSVTGTLTPTVPLSAGAHTLSYSLSDAAGNESGTSPTLALTVTVPVNPSVNLSEQGSGIGGFVINGISAAEQTGYNVAYGGDINGDGLADMIVGARYSDLSAADGGRTYVVFGKTNTTAIDLSAVAAGNGGFVVNGTSASEFSGWSVSSAGDINGDGLADLIVGAPYNDTLIADAGRSYVVFGKTDTTAVNLSTIATGTGGFVINGNSVSEFSGWNVSSAGDINGDGLADMIVNSPYSDPATGADAGRTYVVFGKLNTAAVNLSAVAAGTGGFVIDGSSASELTGNHNIYGKTVSAAGDINGDGLADLIIGAPYSDPTTGGDAGRTYVVFGKTGTTAINLSAVAAGMGGFVINGNSAAELSGWSVAAAGDVNGDGLADVVLTAPYSDPASVGDAGRAYVVFGKTGSAAVNLSAVAAGTGGFAISGQSGAELLGAWSSVSSAGDFNGDGLADLIVGAAYSDPANAVDGGRTYVVFGKTDTTTINTSNLAAGVGGFAINGSSASEFTGWSASAAGDVNGDGLADILIGAPLSDPAGGGDAGRSYVVFGTTTGIGTSTYVDQMGTSGNDNFVSAGSQTLVGGLGDDTLQAKGADVLYGGAGDDVFVLDQGMVTALQSAFGSGGNVAQLSRVDGGTGIDIIRLAEGTNLDLTLVANQGGSNPEGGSRINSVERIDLATDAAVNTLKLDLQDVLDMSGMNSFNTDNGWTNTSGAPQSVQVQSHQLVIDGNVNDVVDLVGASDWTQAGTVTSSINGVEHTYNVWNANGAYAQMLIDAQITVHPVI